MNNNNNNSNNKIQSSGNNAEGNNASNVKNTNNTETPVAKPRRRKLGARSTASPSSHSSKASTNHSHSYALQESESSAKAVDKEKFLEITDNLASSKTTTTTTTDTATTASANAGDKQDVGNPNSNDDLEQSEVIFHLKDIKKKRPAELIDLATSLEIENPSALNKHELIFVILKALGENGAVMIADGTLDVLQEGYGFLRSACINYEPSPDDIYVSPHIIRRAGLRTGDVLTGPIRMPKRNERYFALSAADTINGVEFGKQKRVVHFEDLTPLYPNERLVMETVKSTASNDVSGRIIDIVAPLGKGQRALIVAPPRTGKTILMENIAHSITANNPNIALIALLIGERPEEVTDMQRSIKGEVVSSTFDEPCQRHVQLAEMVIQKAKRMVENNKDVVILLDSITRLARAYNNIAPSSGRVLTGGVDANALQRPKRFFGAARNIEGGGSLTIIATALVDTGSKMDEVIFEEFKGTGNSEIVLERKLSDRRIFPAIDIKRSGTRKEDLFFGKDGINKIWVLRKILSPMGVVDASEFLISKMKDTKSNAEFFAKMNGPM